MNDRTTIVCCSSSGGAGGGTPGVQAWAAAARAGVAAVQKYGGAAPGHRTMLDALLPAVDNLEKATGGFKLILPPPE